MECFPFELRIRPHHEYRNLNFFYVVKLKLFLCLSPLHHNVFDMERSPCDFHLIPKMKEPFRGIRFRTVPEILQAVDRSIRTMNTTGAAKVTLRLPHRWQRVVQNAGDYIEGQ